MSEIEIVNMIVKKAMRIQVFDLRTDALKARLELLKDLNFTNTSESVPIESQGVEVARFDTTKAFVLNGSQSVITEGLLELQTGRKIETIKNSRSIRCAEDITVRNNKAATTRVATGIPGREIQWLYPHGEKSGYINGHNRIEQDIAVGDGKFTYDPETKEIVFAPGAYPDGTTFLCSYYPLIPEVKKIVCNSNTFSEAGRIELDMAIEDMCDHEQFLGKFIIPNGKFSGSFDLSFDGTNPPVQNFEITSQLGCSGAGDLWQWYVYKSDMLGSAT